MRKQVVVVLATGVLTACLSRPTARFRPPDVVVSDTASTSSAKPSSGDVRAPGPLAPSGAAKGQQGSAIDSRGSRPQADRMNRGRSFDGDLRTLPHVAPRKKERPEADEPLM